MKKVFTLITVFIFTITNITTAQDSHKERESPFSGASFGLGQEIQGLLTTNWVGVYSNENAIGNSNITDDEANNPMYKPQNIIIHPIFLDNSQTEEQWYYMGWYMVGMPEHALDQMICRVYAEGNQAKVDMYTVPNPYEYEQEWLKDEPFQGLSKEEILETKSTTLNTSLMTNDGVRLYTTMAHPMEKKGQDIPYSYLAFDMSFYPKHITSNIKFLDENKEPLEMNALNLPLEKIKKNPQKFK